MGQKNFPTTAQPPAFHPGRVPMVQQPQTILGVRVNPLELSSQEKNAVLAIVYML
jgi:hypothetical protein